mmetsp:Transcript_4728/g.12130  ORF Transcript_4728/g.12130 Transcript_4728/m.12130 type:complete len:296 (+) Transcript_4728:291-1178(+)
MEIGPISFLRSHVVGSVIFVERERACPPGHFLMVHSTVRVDSRYVATCVPRAAAVGSCAAADVTDLGSVKEIRTFTAWSLSGKSALTVSCSSFLLSESTWTVGQSLNGNCRSERSVPIRKFITTNSPEGGVSVITRSLSNRSSETHSWKLTSSNCACPYNAPPPPPLSPPRPLEAITRSSFRARCTCGCPFKKDFIWMHPSTEKERTAPSAVMSAEMRSTKSMKISFPLPARQPARPAPSPCGCAITDLCAAADAIVFGFDLKDGITEVTEEATSTGIGLLKRNGCRSVVVAFCG